MNAYVAAIHKLEDKFYGLEFIHVPRTENQAADELSKLGSSRADVPHGVFVQDLLTPSIEEEKPDVDKPAAEQWLLLLPTSSPTEQTVAPVVDVADQDATDQPSDPSKGDEHVDQAEDDEPSIDQPVEQVKVPQPDWRIPFIRYLTDEEVPDDKTEAEHLVRRSRHYVLVDGQLMRKNAKAELLQKCITQEDGMELLDKIYSGTCGNHAASRTLVGKAFRAGFYWPSAVADAEHLVRHYKGCQFFTKQIHVPAQEL